MARTCSLGGPSLKTIRRSAAMPDETGTDAKALRYNPRNSLACAPVGDDPLPISNTMEATRGTGVHVRLTESLKVLCSRHLELSGSRAYAGSGMLGSYLS